VFRGLYMHFDLEGSHSYERVLIKTKVYDGCTSSIVLE